MLKKHFLLLFVILILSCQKKDSKTQPKIDEINFSYESGLRIPYNKVHINISRFSSDSAQALISTEPLLNESKWSYSKIEKLVKIDIKTFEKLAKEAVLLDSINIDKAYKLGFDGSTWEIKYGSKGKNKSYTFWSPKSNTKERGLSKFVILCEQIVEISKLKKEDILEN